MRLPFDRLRAASAVMAVGWGLVVAGGAAVAAASVAFDPASASGTARTIVTAAFGSAQTGLALVAIAGFLRIYFHAARLMRGRGRKP